MTTPSTSTTTPTAPPRPTAQYPLPGPSERLYLEQEILDLEHHLGIPDIRFFFEDEARYRARKRGSQQWFFANENDNWQNPEEWPILDPLLWHPDWFRQLKMVFLLCRRDVELVKELVMEQRKKRLSGESERAKIGLAVGVKDLQAVRRVLAGTKRPGVEELDYPFGEKELEEEMRIEEERRVERERARERS